MQGPIDLAIETLSRAQLEAEVRRLHNHSAALARMFEQAPSFIALLSGPKHRSTLTNAADQRAIDHRDVTGRTPTMSRLSIVIGCRPAEGSGWVVRRASLAFADPAVVLS